MQKLKIKNTNQNSKLFDQRMRKARQWARIIGRNPNIVMVTLTGSMAEGRARCDSDIDFFIQVNPGRLWTTRFRVTLLAALIGERPTPGNRAGKICLNWWGTDNFPRKRRIKHKILYQDLSKQQHLKSHWLEKILKVLQTERLKSDPALKKGWEIRLSDRELALRHRTLPGQKPD